MPTSRDRTSARQPIAIVGISCRYQDIEDPGEFWDLMLHGRRATRTIPADRFEPSRYYDPEGGPGRFVARDGGYLRSPWDFDPQPFGLSHHEARAIEPEDRLLLELAYLAMLDAGMSPTSRMGRRVAVMLGAREDGARTPDVGPTDASGPAQRIARTFGWTGAAISVVDPDASSLMAVHHGCRALWQGEATHVLAGGGELLLEPEALVRLSQAGWLTGEYHSRFGDGAAAGMIRSEGGAIVVLKLLDAAVHDGDRVYATIEATEVDVFPVEPGSAAPEPGAQAAVLHQVYAGIGTERLAYIEAHGTGVPDSDRAELSAFVALSRGRSETLWTGSGTSNLGHAGVGAGIGRLVRAALAVHHGLIPPTVHVRTPRPDVRWEEAALALPIRAVPLEPSDAHVGVHATSPTGVVAHVVLGPPPPAPDPGVPAAELWLLPIDGYTPEAVRHSARCFRGAVRSADPAALRDLCFTAAQRRERLPYRALAVGATAAELADSVHRIAMRDPHLPTNPGRALFVFPGGDGAWAGMVRRLTKASPTMDRQLAQVDHAFQRVMGWSVVDALASPSGEWLTRDDRAPAVVVAVQIAIAAMWRRLGVQPAAVAGHREGEVSAAVVAGALSLYDAAQVMAAWTSVVEEPTEDRGGAVRRALVELKPGPTTMPLMSGLEASWIDGDRLRGPHWARLMWHDGALDATARALVEAGHHNVVECAPYRGFASSIEAVWEAEGHDGVVVGTGRCDAVGDEVRLRGLARLFDRGVPLDFATAQGEGRVVSLPLVPLRRVRLDLPPSAASADGTTHPWLSRPLRLGTGNGARVWQIPLPVETSWIREHRIRGRIRVPPSTFVELALASGAATLGRAVTLCDLELAEVVTVDEGPAPLLQVQVRPVGADAAAVSMHVVDEAGALRRCASGRVEVPDERAGWSTDIPRALLTERLEVEHERARRNPAHVYGLLEVSLEAGDDPVGLHLSAHRVARSLRASDAVFPMGKGRVVVVASVSQIEQVHVVARRLLGVLGGVDDVHRWVQGLSFRGCAVVPHDAPVEDVMAHVDTGLPSLQVGLSSSDRQTMHGAALYDSLRARGMDYGPQYQGIRVIRGRPGVANAEIEVPVALVDALSTRPTHPVLLETCSQAAVASFLRECDERDGYVPVGLQRLTSLRVPEGDLVCHAWHRGRPRGRDDELIVDVVVVDASRRPVLSVDGLRMQRIPATLDEPLGDRIERWTYHAEWSRRELESAYADPRPWLLVGHAPSLVAALNATPVHRIASDLDALPPGPAGVVVVVPAGDDPVAATLAIVDAVRAIERRTHPGDLQLWVVTQSAWRVRDESSCSPGHAAVWGAVRVLANEMAELSPKLVDTDSLSSSALAEVISYNLAIDEVAVRGDTVWQRLLVPGRPAPRSTAGPSDDEPAMVMFEPGTPGFTIQRRARVAALPGELVLKIEAVTWSRLGPAAGLMAVVGRVDQVGDVDAVEWLGRRVVSLSGASLPRDQRRLARQCAVTAAQVVQIGDAVDGMQACRLAAHWLPAMEALRGVSAGDRVFVASAEAPIAQAAAWLATERGAVVVAAARGLAARAALRACGIPYVVDARSANLPVLALDLAGTPFDRIIDLAGALPRVVLQPLVGAQAELVVGTESIPLGPDVRTHSLAGPVIPRQVAAMRSLLAATAPLPQLWGDVPLLEVSAERDHPWSSWSLHLDWVPAAVPHDADRALSFDPKGTYVISGGTGAVGLRLAAWLGRRGARTIVLVSKSGRIRPENAVSYEAVAASGADISVVAADVSDRDAVARVIELARSDGPIRGVFHLPMILDEATWAEIDEARLRRVMEPTVLGAWNLHYVTMDEPVDHFVVFSSVTGTVGPPGRAVDAAASAALDSLAQARGAAGLPCASIAWGVWNESSTGPEDRSQARLQHRGVRAMSPADALEALGEVMRRGLHDVVLADVNWARWVATHPAAGRRASLAAVAPAPQPPATTEAALSDLPPLERAERVLRDLRYALSEVTQLAAARIDDRTSLAALGLDTMMATELRAVIYERIGVELSVHQLLAEPVLGRLAETVLQAWDRKQGAPLTAGRSMADVALPASIRPSRGPARIHDDAVLLTGATGFVGAHLLRALLDETTHRVVCLVRAESHDEAWGRVSEQLRKHDLLRATDGPRIEVLHGDLSAARLGLPVARFEALGARIRAIYHCGAWVNHVYDYATLAPTNVDGTAEVLRLAVTGPLTPVHHVSSLAVFPVTSGSPDDAPLTEDSPLADRAEALLGGYAATKWAAERLCEEARRRDVPVTVYRLGVVSGSRQQGSCPSGHAVWRLVHGVASLGQVPDVRGQLSLTPVDFVSRAIVELSGQSDVVGRTFHLLGPATIGVDQLADALARVGVPVSAVPLATWFERLPTRMERGWPMAPLAEPLQALAPDVFDQGGAPVSCEETLARLPDEIRTLRTVDATLLTIYLQRFLRDGFLPVPYDAAVTPVLPVGVRGPSQRSV